MTDPRFESVSEVREGLRKVDYLSDEGIAGIVYLADALRLARGVGFCGGFTTFSTFEYENHALLEDGAWLSAAANMGLSLFAGLVAVRLGILAARSWF